MAQPRDRQARLAQALRDNLKRRKAKSRSAGDGPLGSDPADEDAAAIARGDPVEPEGARRNPALKPNETK